MLINQYQFNKFMGQSSFKGKNCILRKECHQILVQLGFEDVKKRNAIIVSALKSTEINSNYFASPDLLKIVEQWTNQDLKAQYFSNLLILQELRDFRLKKVLRIDVRNNYICSIEGLSKMEAVNLKQINLAFNWVTTIKELRKVHWMCITNFCIAFNFVMDCHVQYWLDGDITSMNMATDHQHGRFHQDYLHWIAKMKSRSLKSLNLGYLLQTQIHMRVKLSGTLLSQFPSMVIKNS